MQEIGHQILKSYPIMARLIYTLILLPIPLLRGFHAEDDVPSWGPLSREMDMRDNEVSQVDTNDIISMGLPPTVLKGKVGKGQEDFNLTLGQPKLSFVLRIAYFDMMVDGVSATPVLGVNGRFPAPLIQAREDDFVTLEVINQIRPLGPKLDITNTSIHWHGLLQNGSPMHDGMNHITQCPIKAGSRRTYNFHLKQSGTYWYHSHLRSQYTEGLWGVFLIHPKVPKHHFDRRHVVALSDWYHTSSEENERFYLSPASAGGPPYPFTILMNGRGRYSCPVAAKQNRRCDERRQVRPVFRLQRGKVHVFHLVNSAAWSSFNFTIDGHVLEVVEVEGSYLVRPQVCDAIHNSPGQRYAFILRPKLGVEMRRGDYLIRAYLRKDFLFRPPNVPNINPFPDAIFSQVTGVIRYVDTDLGNGIETTEVFTWKDRIPPPQVNAGSLAYFDDLNAPSRTLPPSRVDVTVPLQVDFVNGADGIRRGAFNNFPFVLPPGAPLIHFMLKDKPYPPGIHNYNINLGQVVQIVVNNPGAGAHPIHLHGHNFHVMALGVIGAGNYDPARHTLTRRGVTRDTVVVHERSHLVIRFVSDNPGLWVLHCHIDWHLLSGMLVVFTEGAEEARRKFEFSEKDKRLCRELGIIIRH